MADREKIMREVAKRLKAFRATLGEGMTTDLFAAGISLGGPAYRRYERAEVATPIEVLYDIGRIYECSLDWLILNRGTAKPGRPKGRAL